MATRVVNWAELHPVQGLVRPPLTPPASLLLRLIARQLSSTAGGTRTAGGGQAEGGGGGKAEEVIDVDTTSRGCDSFEAPHEDAPH